MKKYTYGSIWEPKNSIWWSFSIEDVKYLGNKSYTGKSLQWTRPQYELWDLNGLTDSSLGVNKGSFYCKLKVNLQLTSKTELFLSQMFLFVKGVYYEIFFNCLSWILIASTFSSKMKFFWQMSEMTSISKK